MFPAKHCQCCHETPVRVRLNGSRHADRGHIRFGIVSPTEEGEGRMKVARKVVLDPQMLQAPPREPTFDVGGSCKSSEGLGAGA